MKNDSPDETTATVVQHEVVERLTGSLDNLDFEAVTQRVTITVEEAASLLGIGRSAAYDAARRGQLPTRRLGRRLFVPVPALLDWLGATGRSGQSPSLKS